MDQTRMRRFYPSALLLLSSLLLSWEPVSAQSWSDLSVRVLPRFGLLSPDNYFYERFKTFAADQPTEWTTGSLGRAAVASLALELGLPEQGVYLRGELGRSFSGWLSAVHGIVQPRVYWDPPQVVNTWLDVPATLTFANLQLVLPTRFEVWRLRPYVLAGSGGKWYHFGSPTEPNTVEAILPSGGFTAALELGGGALVTLFGLDFDVQVRESINRYWGKTQHDLILSGGLSWRIR